MLSFKNIVSLGMVLLYTINLNANHNLIFNSTVTNSEDNWIVCPPLSDWTYQFGFVYNGKSGLIFKLEGVFKIISNGQFERVAATILNQNATISDGKAIVAILPPEKFQDLNIEQFPTWYQNEVVINESAGQLFAKGYTLNLKKEFNQAIIFFNKAYILDPNHPSLKIHYAKALNASKNFKKANDLLTSDEKTSKNSYEFHQEYAIALINLGMIAQAETHAKKTLKLCELNSPRCNICLVFAQHYFDKKDKERLDYWLNNSQTFVNEDKNAQKKINAMLTEASKW